MQVLQAMMEIVVDLLALNETRTLRASLKEYLSSIWNVINTWNTIMQARARAQAHTQPHTRTQAHTHTHTLHVEHRLCVLPLRG